MGRIINFFKKLLFRKEEVLEESVIYENLQKTYKEIEKSKRNEAERLANQRVKEERKELLKKWAREKKVEKTKSLTKHQVYQDLVDNIEKNRESIVKTQVASIPKIKRLVDGVEYTFKGKTFIFDKGGYWLFETDFKNFYYDIIIRNGYLARQHKERGFVKEFHRWLMEEEVKEFAEVNKYPTKDIQVHHLDLTTTNNRKNNLKPMTKEEHKKFHFRLLFEGTDKEFEKWYAEKISLT